MNDDYPADHAAEKAPGTSYETSDSQRRSNAIINACDEIWGDQPKDREAFHADRLQNQLDAAIFELKELIFKHAATEATQRYEDRLRIEALEERTTGH